VLGLFSFLGFYLISSGRLEAALSGVRFLKIQEVRISSDWPLTPGTIRTWLPPLEGKNIFFVKPMRLIETLERHSWVEGVTIKKDYPNRLVVDVTTKRAEAIFLSKGSPYFLDGKGTPIDRTTPELFRALDLPIVSWENDSLEKSWKLSQALHILARVKKELEPLHRVSQLTFSQPPVFKLFLLPHRIEADFSIENWETQIGHLAEVLKTPPLPLSQIRKINLVFPKKAIVSSNLSN